jgi:hypothetical protein
MAAAPHLPPITRESLKALYSKNPADPLPQALIDALPKLEAALAASKKRLSDSAWRSGHSWGAIISLSEQNSLLVPLVRRNRPSASMRTSGVRGKSRRSSRR